MNLSDLLSSAVQQQLGARAGTNPQQTNAALQSALPLLLSALAGNASTPSGSAALQSALSDHRGDTIGLIGQGQFPDPTQSQKMLGHIFGGGQINAAQQVSQQAGIPPETAMQVLMTAAPMVMNLISRQASAQPTQHPQGLSGLIGGLLGGLGAQSMGGLGGQVNGAANVLGTLNRALDRDGDGNALNDIMGMLGRK